MASSVYSKVFMDLHGVGSGDIEVITFEPDGYVWVVRCIDVFLAGVGGGEFNVYDDAGATFFAAQVPDASGSWQQWRGRQVFNPGNQISFEPQLLDPLGHADIRISGYQLSA